MEELKKKFLFLENWLTSSYSRRLLLIFLFGIVLIGFGAFFFKSGLGNSSTKVEVLESTTEDQGSKEIIVEIAGEVEKPGVYKLSSGARIEDLLVSGGGFGESADRVWADRFLNRAARLTDGQKVYIPKIGEQSEGASAKESGGDQSGSSNFSDRGSGSININTASLSQLDKLPGIGPVYGQSIIDHRPYSTIEELVSKGALKQSVYEKIKDSVAVY